VLGEPGRAAPIFVASISPGSVADDNGGLRVGDRILSINGRSCEEITQGRAQELLAKASMRMTLMVRHEAVAFERYKSSERRLKPKLALAPARLCVLARPGRVSDPEFDLGMRLMQRVLESGDTGVFVAQVIPSAQAGKAGIVRGDRVLAVGDQDTTYSTVEKVRNAIAGSGRAVMINLAYRPMEFAGRNADALGGSATDILASSSEIAKHSADENVQTPTDRRRDELATGQKANGNGDGGHNDEDDDNEEDGAEQSLSRPGDADDGEEEDDEDDLAEEEDEFDEEELDMRSRARQGALYHHTSVHYQEEGAEDDIGVSLRRLTTGSRHDHDRHRSRLWSGSHLEADAFEEEDSGLAHARLPRHVGRLPSSREPDYGRHSSRGDRNRPYHDSSEGSGGELNALTRGQSAGQNFKATPGFQQEHYPGAPKVHRSVVHECSWDHEDATYNPTRHTDRVVLHTRRADPNLTRNQRRGADGILDAILHFNTMDGDVDRRSHAGRYDLGTDGLPRNPHGRTGLRGRGLYNLWGPNHAVHVLVSRWCRETTDGVDRVVQEDGRPVLEVMTLNDMEIGQQCLPSVFLRPGEEPAIAIERALEYAGKGQVGTAPLTTDSQAHVREGGGGGGGAHKDNEAGHVKKRESKDSDMSDVALFGANPTMPLHAQAAQLVKQRIFRHEIINMQIHSGLLDDPRNTDNAWIETLAINYHDDAGLLNGIEFGDPSMPGTSPVQWTRVACESSICPEQQQLLRELSAAHQAFYQCKRRRRHSNSAMLAVYLRRTSNDPFGFKLGTTAQGAHVIHSVQPNSLATDHLLPGDIVLDVNHVPIVGWSHQDVRRVLKNNATLQLLVKRKKLPSSTGSRRTSTAPVNNAKGVILPPPTVSARSELMRVTSEGKVIPVEVEAHSASRSLREDESQDTRSRPSRGRRGRRQHRSRQEPPAAAGAFEAAHMTGELASSIGSADGRAGRSQSRNRDRPQKAQRMEVELQRESLQADFGITIGSDSSGVHEISSVEPGSRAAAFMRVGDAVAAINGVDLAGRLHEEVEDLCVDATKLMLTLVRPPVGSSKLTRRLKSMHHSTLEWMRHPTLHGAHGTSKHGDKPGASHKGRGVVGQGESIELAPMNMTVPVAAGVIGRADAGRHRWQTVELHRQANGGFGVEITHTISNQHIVTGCSGPAVASQLERGDHIVAMNGLEVPELTRRVMTKLASFTDHIVLKVVRGCVAASLPPAENKTLDLGLDERHAKQAIDTLGAAAASTLAGGAVVVPSVTTSPPLSSTDGSHFGSTSTSRRETHGSLAQSEHTVPEPKVFDVKLRRVNGMLGLRLQGRENQDTGEQIIVVEQVVAPPASLTVMQGGEELIAARGAHELQWHNLRNRTVEEATAVLSELGDHLEMRLVAGEHDNHFGSMRRPSLMTKHPSVRVRVEEEGESPSISGRKHRRRRSKVSVESM
jgi:ADP-ribose pyrophosphatase